MQIFATSENAEQAARWLCDKHLPKQVVESAQLLANCFTLDRLADIDCPRTQKGTARTHSYLHHPCAKWTQATLGNMLWLLDHVKVMLDEKYKRFPDAGRHFTHNFIDWVDANIEDSTCPVGPRTDFAIAINENSNCRKLPQFNNVSSVEKYRLYYKMDKPFATWRSNKPFWI